MIAHTPMIEERPTTREPGRFYIDELSAIVNRKPDTIRKWERSDMLPKHLLPKRGTRDWRYWSDKQVFGPRGILAWMKKNDIRPGAYLTMPADEEQHIANMRRPRGISPEMVDEIRYYAKTFKSGDRAGQHRRSRQWIIDTYWPQTSYVSKENFEKALANHFLQQGWEFPPSGRPRGAPPSKMSRKQIEKHPEVRRARRDANRIIRFVDKRLKTTKGK
jgi:hypothetical protein